MNSFEFVYCSTYMFRVVLFYSVKFNSFWFSMCYSVLICACSVWIYSGFFCYVQFLLLYSVSFVLLCFDMFCSDLFCSVLFYVLLGHFMCCIVLFFFALFRSVLLWCCSVLLYFAPLFCCFVLFEFQFCSVILPFLMVCPVLLFLVLFGSVLIGCIL